MDGSERIRKSLEIYPEGLDICITSNGKEAFAKLTTELGNKFKLIREEKIPDILNRLPIDNTRAIEEYLNFISDLYCGAIGHYWIDFPEKKGEEHELLS